jgi:hypothetical protein
MSGDVLQVITKPPFRDVRGRFVRADAAMLEDRREMVRTLGRRWVEIARTEAPRKSGDFQRSISYKTFQRGQAIELRAYHAQPLGNWIIGGTAPHQIAPKGGALYFFWPKIGRFVVVPKGGGFKTHVRKDGNLWVGKGFVSHPGTKANPYTARAYRRWQPLAEVELKRLARGYVMALKGKA